MSPTVARHLAAQRSSRPHSHNTTTNNKTTTTTIQNLFAFHTRIFFVRAWNVHITIVVAVRGWSVGSKVLLRRARSRACTEMWGRKRKAVERVENRSILRLSRLFRRLLPSRSSPGSLGRTQIDRVGVGSRTQIVDRMCSGLIRLLHIAFATISGLTCSSRLVLCGSLPVRCVPFLSHPAQLSICILRCGLEIPRWLA